jgi:hypothetical protein
MTVVLAITAGIVCMALYGAAETLVTRYTTRRRMERRIRRIGR